MREGRVAVTEKRLEPGPIRRAVPAMQFHQPAGQDLTGVLRGAVSVEVQQVLVDPHQAEGPGTGVHEIQGGRHRSREERPRQTPQALLVGSLEDCPEPPERSPVGVLGAALVEPAPVITHLVSESAGFLVECI